MKTLTTILATIILLVMSFTANAQTYVLKANEIVLTTTIEDGQTLITWSTNKEINTSYFLVEKSTDGIHFTAIKMINAAGKSDVKRTYGFSEELNVQLTATYRIVVVTMNGQQIASAPTTVNPILNIASN